MQVHKWVIGRLNGIQSIRHGSPPFCLGDEGERKTWELQSLPPRVQSLVSSSPLSAIKKDGRTKWEQARLRRHKARRRVGESFRSRQDSIRPQCLLKERRAGRSRQCGMNRHRTERHKNLAGQKPKRATSWTSFHFILIMQSKVFEFNYIHTFPQKVLENNNEKHKHWWKSIVSPWNNIFSAVGLMNSKTTTNIGQVNLLFIYNFK